MMGEDYGTGMDGRGSSLRWSDDEEGEKKEKRERMSNLGGTLSIF